MSKHLDTAIQSHIAGLEKKMGKPIDFWTDLVKAWPQAKHMAHVKRLKEEFGMGHGHANMVVILATESSSLHKSSDDLDAAMFKNKEHWRPLHEALVVLVKGLDAEVEFAHKKGYVSLRTSKQIGCLKPATKTRYEVQINLKGVEPSGLLQAMKPGQMCSHVIHLAEGAEEDLEEVRSWLNRAVEMAG